LTFPPVCLYDTGSFFDLCAKPFARFVHPITESTLLSPKTVKLRICQMDFFAKMPFEIFFFQMIE